MTCRITIDPEEAAAVIRAGGVVALPTETVYGLGGDATNPHAVARIFSAKGRPAFDPLIVHLAEIADLPQVVRDVPARALQLAVGLGVAGAAGAGEGGEGEEKHCSFHRVYPYVRSRVAGETWQRRCLSRANHRSVPME